MCVSVHMHACCSEEWQADERLISSIEVQVYIKKEEAFRDQIRTKARAGCLHINL